MMRDALTLIDPLPFDRQALQEVGGAALLRTSLYIAYLATFWVYMYIIRGSERLGPSYF